MEKWFILCLLISSFWFIFILQDASAVIRFVRSSNKSSKFIHHALEEDSTTTEDTDVASRCMNISDPDDDSQERSKRSSEIDDDTKPDTESPIKVEKYSDEFVNCEGHTLVEKGCYEMLPNRSVYVPVYKRLFNTTDYVVQEDRHIYVCNNFFQSHDDYTTLKFDTTLAIFSLVGTAISTFCIALHIVMFLTFQKLRNLPGYSLLSLCIALLIAYICNFIPYGESSSTSCDAIGIIKAYAFLASVFWMNVMSYDIWRSLKMATAKLRLTADRPMLIRFAMYSAYSWGIPFLIIAFGLIINNTESQTSYKLLIDHQTCWFKYKQALLLYFAAPLFMLLFVNILLFISSFYMITRATMNTSENKADLWSRFLICMRLAVVMGLMWVFGVLATATQAIWLFYLNVIFNVLQGVFIFFSFTLGGKTRKECRKALTRKKSVNGGDIDLQLGHTNVAYGAFSPVVATENNLASDRTEQKNLE